MKARIEKKLSKRLAELAPTVLGRVWVDSGEPSILAYEQGSRVSNIKSVGGGVNHFGEGEDAFTTWSWWLHNWMWHGGFAPYPAGHEHQHYPNTDGFKKNTLSLIRLAVVAERCAIAEVRRISESRRKFLGPGQ